MARLQQVLRSATSSRNQPYCPDSGDVVWISLDPTLGTEQSGRRTALVVSERAYNERARLCVLCPTTNQSKRYPFEVEIPAGHDVTGVVLADQVKSLSWAERDAQLLCRAPEGVLAHTKAKIKALLAIT